MNSELTFNTQVPLNTFQKKQLTVKPGPHVRASHSAVTMVTASCEGWPYVDPIAEIASQTGSHPW